MERPLRLLYNLTLPIYVLLALPAWLWKTTRRGGWGRELLERFGIYDGTQEFEPTAAVHVHAVSVGETILALKLIRAWQQQKPRSFVLAVATTTAHQLAHERLPQGVRLVFQPIDFSPIVTRYFKRFEPVQLVLVEGEMWPNLLHHCEKRNIPVDLVNARMSPRSQRRYKKFAALVRPLFRKLNGVALQQEGDREIWEFLGVKPERIHVTGSLKFDPSGIVAGESREEFREMLTPLSRGRKVVLLASSHAGEEELLAQSILAVGAFPLIIPRHAERRMEVLQALEQIDIHAALRSAAPMANPEQFEALVVDSTGELKDWIEEADVVVIGKSFLSIGGQNPAEAILAGKPILFGAHMENFQPLARELVQAGGAIEIPEQKNVRELSGMLQEQLRNLLFSEEARYELTSRAMQVVKKHEGAVQKVCKYLQSIN